MRYYGGIDPGLQGALVLVDDDGQYVSAEIVPKFAERVDPSAFFRLLKGMTEGKDCHFYLEKAFCMPKQGRVGILNYGIYNGFCEMALVALGIPYELVMPKTWQQMMHSGIDKRVKLPKLKSALKVQRMMGLDKFMVGRQKNPHTGLVDAYLIAVFCQRMVTGKRGYPFGRRPKDAGEEAGSDQSETGESGS